MLSVGRREEQGHDINNRSTMPVWTTERRRRRKLVVTGSFRGLSLCVRVCPAREMLGVAAERLFCFRGCPPRWQDWAMASGGTVPYVGRGLTSPTTSNATSELTQASGRSPVLSAPMLHPNAPISSPTSPAVTASSMPPGWTS